MKNATTIRSLLFSILLACPAFLFAQSTTVTLEAAKDNTLYFSEGGSLSNGSGSHLFCGRDAQGGRKRALVQFDLSSIPANAMIDSVRLTMNMSTTISGATTISLRRLTSDWGEGASDAFGEEGAGAAAATNDATWVHTFFNSETWNSPGGDFVPTPSASRSVSGVGSYSWGSTSGMVADAQRWVNNASENFGWILIGNEEMLQTAKRFESRENANTANRPQLIVHYSQSTSVVDRNALPESFRLDQNYPNPFNPKTTITYALNAPAKVTLTVFDLLGNAVAVLVDEEKNSGEYQVVFNAVGLESGVYFYQIDVAGQIETRKLTLVK